MRSLRVGSGALSLSLAAGLAVLSGPTRGEAAAPPVATAVNGLVAFDAGTTGTRDIYVSVPHTGATPVQLTSAAGDDRSPSWSADGGRIVFSSARDGDADIWVMEADGSEQTRLTTSTDPEDEPVFSPDGARIAFTRWHTNGAGSVPEVWVMDADGGNQTLLTCTTAPPGDPYPDRCHNTSPAWSPDGATVAVTSARRGDDEIFAVAASGDPQSDLTSAPASQERYADWSPDGSSLVLVSDRGGGPLFTMHADGSGTTPMPGAATDATEPSWSPDGLAVAYMSHAGDHWQVHVMGVDGVESAILSMPGVDLEHPDWQPVAAPVLRRPDLWVRRSDRTTWVGDDVYAPARQRVTGTVKRGRSVRLWVAAENDGTDPDVLVLRGTGTGRGLTVAYRRGSTPVTRAVVGGTCRLPSLAPGASLRTLRVDVTVSAKAPRGATRTLTLRATSAGTAVTDLVTIRIRVS